MTIKNHAAEWRLPVLTERIRRIDNEKENTQARSMPDSSLHVDFRGASDERIIETGEDGLGTKCLSSPDSRDHLFGYAATLSNVLQGEPDMT